MRLKLLAAKTLDRLLSVAAHIVGIVLVLATLVLAASILLLPVAALAALAKYLFGW